MKLDVSDDQLAGFVSAAILGAVSEAQRDELIKDAIRFLLTPSDKSRGYGYTRRTPLQDAFDIAVEGVCREMVKEMFQKDEAVRREIKKVITEGYQRALADHEPLISAIAASIAKGFRDSL